MTTTIAPQRTDRLDHPVPKRLNVRRLHETGQGDLQKVGRGVGVDLKFHVHDPVVGPPPSQSVNRENYNQQSRTGCAGPHPPANALSLLWNRSNVRGVIQPNE